MVIISQILFLINQMVSSDPLSVSIWRSNASFFLIWRPPALPHRLQCSTIGRLGLNRRVRDGNGCVPQTHRHQKFRVTQVSARIFPEVRRKLASVRAYGISRICDAVATEELSFRGQHLRLITQQWNTHPSTSSSLERRWSSRTFRYGYLVTTSPQLLVLPSAASVFGSLISGITNSHGVTGGVYKTRERIHRSMLICDY